MKTCLKRKIILELIGKKVLIIVENLPLPFDRRVWQEANSLKKHGAQVSIICPKAEGYMDSYAEINGIHIYRHPMPSEGNGFLGYLFEYSTALFWEIVLSVKILFRHGFDVIQACNPPDLIFLVVAPFKLLGKKFIFDHHDINPELFEAKFNKKGFLYKALLLMEKLTFKSADISIATNNSYKEIAIHRGNMKPQNVFVVRSGPKLERLKIMTPQPGLKYNKSILIGYVGVIGKQEGIDHLLEALKILKDKFSFKDFHCTICGSGPALKEMKELAKKMKLTDSVNFTGRIPDDELLRILNSSDICVNPDVWNEMNDKSTMNKIMEYMALAKPIVQYDMVEGKYSALTSSLYAKQNDQEDFARCIYDLIQNPDLRIKMGQFGKNRVHEELQWDIEEPKLINAYKKVFMQM